jgi:hypothetical protein
MIAGSTQYLSVGYAVNQFLTGMLYYSIPDKKTNY